MDAQANSIVSTCNYHIRSLRHIRNRLILDMAKTIACGLVLSRLDYCNSLLFGISDHNMNKLQVVQNCLARTVAYCSTHGEASAHQALRQLHWLPVAQRIKYKIAVNTQTARATSQPIYLHQLISNYVPSRALRSSDPMLLQEPRKRTAAAAHSFSSAAPTIWNNLSLATRTCTTLNILSVI
jgi:hypothetical protein